MSSESSPASHGSGAFVFNGVDASVGAASSWHSVERRVLLTKLEDLEEKARRLQHLESRLRDLGQEVQLLSRLGEAIHAIHSAGDFWRLLDTVAEECAEVLRAESGSVLLREPQGHELVVAKAFGAGSRSLEGLRVPLGQGVAGCVALSGEPLEVADIEKDGRFPPRASARYATGSFLCVPVQADGSVLGVLSVADCRDRQPFGAGGLRAATALARELAVALRRVRQAEAAQALQRQWVSKLAHELRNPLDGALRFINLTLADHPPEESRRRYLLASKQGLERLTGIVSSLTEPSRRARGDGDAVQVNELIEQALALQEGKAQQRGVRVELDLGRDLPPVTGGGALFQVFTNLISNAYDAMEAGGGTLSVASRCVGGEVVVQVADTGRGMPPEVLERLFTPFFTTKPPGQGMGLGLAVCREVLDRLRGRIEVASTPGRGAVVTVAVPCGQEDTRSPLCEAPSRQRPPGVFFP